MNALELGGSLKWLEDSFDESSSVLTMFSNEICPPSSLPSSLSQLSPLPSPSSPAHPPSDDSLASLESHEINPHNFEFCQSDSSYKVPQLFYSPKEEEFDFSQNENENESEYESEFEESKYLEKGSYKNQDPNKEENNPTKEELSLLDEMIPLTTKEFNELVKKRGYSNYQIKRLKIFKRRNKNAQASRKRRAKVSSTITQLRGSLSKLSHQKSEIEKNLKATLAENEQLKKIILSLQRSKS